jgi:hypothetical protein
MVVAMGKWLLAVLLTHAADPKSELVLLSPAGPTVMAEFEHLPDGSPHGALLPGGSAVVTVDRTPTFDRSFAGALLKIDGARVTELCDRVVHSSAPLVADGGRVLVERGRAGPEFGDRLRVDELTIEEATPGGMRVVARARGYLLHLAGVEGRELIVYRVDPDGASILGVDVDSGVTRVIVRALPPFARDFSIISNGENGQLVLANRDDERRDRWVIERIDLASGRRVRLHTSESQVLAPRAFAGDVAFNDRGLKLLGRGRVEHRAGDDVVAATSGERAALLHYSSLGGAALPELEILEGGQVRQIAAPENTHIQVVGFAR